MMKLQHHLKFSLLVTTDYDRGHVTESCFNVGPESEMAEPLYWRIEPDDVSAIIRRDTTIITLQGGERWVREVFQKRQMRKEAFQYVAGKLGEHALEIIEKAEGWIERD